MATDMPKTALLELILNKFKQQRETFNHYMNNPNELELKLQVGASKAKAIATKTLSDVRVKLGFNPHTPISY